MLYAMVAMAVSLADDAADMVIVMAAMLRAEPTAEGQAAIKVTEADLMVALTEAATSALAEMAGPTLEAVATVEATSAMAMLAMAPEATVVATSRASLAVAMSAKELQEDQMVAAVLEEVVLVASRESLVL